jgi:hypothetical protein
VRKLKVAASAMVLAQALALSACQHVHFYTGVTFGPPAPIVTGPIGVAPYPGWVWTDGFYDWNGSRWVWAPGAMGSASPSPGMSGGHPLTSVTTMATACIQDDGCDVDLFLKHTAQENSP